MHKDFPIVTCAQRSPPLDIALQSQHPVHKSFPIVICAKPSPLFIEGLEYYNMLTCATSVVNTEHPPSITTTTFPFMIQNILGGK